MSSEMQKQFEQLKKEEIVFCCAGCDSPIIRDSRGHDHCNTKDGVSWFCENCDCPSEDNEDEEMQKQIEQLKKELKEYEAVEAYMMKTIKEGGSYDDILRAHYRQGKVVDGVWVDDDNEEEDEEGKAARTFWGSTLCSTKYHKFVIIAMYNHEDEDKEFKTLGEAKAYCDNFLNYHYNDIQRLHRDDINDVEWSYENDWFDEEWQQKEGEEEEEEEEAVWWVYTKDNCNTYEDERWKRGDKWFILRTTMKRSYWTVTGEKPVYHFKDGVCGCCDFEGDGEVEFDSAESDCVEVVGYSDNVETLEKVAVEEALAKGDFDLEGLGWKPTGDCESFFAGPLIIEREEPDDSDEEEEEEEECTDENRCEECTHCARTRLCGECGCVGGCHDKCINLGSE